MKKDEVKSPTELLKDVSFGEMVDDENQNPPNPDTDNDPGDNDPGDNDPPQYSEKQLSLLEDNGGSSFDDDGNILDDEGNILVSAQALEATDDDDDDDDDSGDDSKGKKDDDEGGEEPTLFEELNEALGVDIDIAELQEDPEGLTNYVQQAGAKMTQTAVNNLFQQYPDLGKVFNHLRNGGKLQDITEDDLFDPLQVELAEDDESQHKFIIEQGLKRKGLEEDEIELMVSTMDNNGKLKENAEKYLTSMKTSEKQRIQQEKEQRKEQEQKAKEQAEEEQRKVNELISQGKVLNYAIPEADRKAFLEYIYKPIDQQGRTQADIKRQELNDSEDGLEKLLAMEYLIYKDFNAARAKTSDKKGTRDLSKFRRGKPGAGSRMKGGKGGASTRNASVLNDMEASDIL